MSLTKSKFLEAYKPSDAEFLGDFLGMKLYVKPCSELKRSRRGASMVDNNGNVKKNYRERARAYSIVDSICDENGKWLFDDDDIPAILQLDSIKLDELCGAIQEWTYKSEGNDQSESAK